MNSRHLARRGIVLLTLFLTTVATLGATTYSLTRDFSVSANPNGVWSYGYTPTVGGRPFTLMAAPRTDEVPSIPIWSWSVDGFSSPDVHFNASSNNTFLAEGGTFPPRSLWVSPGHESSSNAFVVMRFTAPASGLYRVQTLAQSYLDEFSGDADFHLATNGTEVLGVFLAAGAQRISTSNQFRLNVGNVVDLIVGRGRDGALYRSALKLGAEITMLQTNGPVGPPPSTNAIPAPSGVVAWWPFEGSGADISGRAHPMQLFGAPAFGAGKVRQALVVGDANDYGRVGPHSDLNLGASEGLTTEMWINPESTAIAQPLLEWTDNDSIVGLHFWISVASGAGGGNGSLFANLIDRNGLAHHVSSAPGVVTANTFTHVALSYSKASGLAKLYANGQLVASTNFGNITPETRHSLYAGWRPIGGEWKYKGRLDEITLYNRELTGHEIHSIYVAGAAGKTNGPVLPPPSTNAIPAPSGVVAWWPFEGSGADISGRAHPMQLLGAPAFGAGKVQQALVVGDANDYGRVGPHSDLDLGANQGLTTEMWINPESTEVQQPLLEWTDNDSIVGLHFWISVASGAGGGNGSLFANLIDRNGLAHHVSSAPGVVTANTFTHVALSYSKASGLAKLYANGQLVASTNFGNITPETRHSLYAGWRPIGGEWRYKGKLDEITLYNRELAGHEINAIFLAGAAGKTNGAVPPNLTNPPPPSATGTYDLARDFALHNPNGVWSYGHTPVLAGPFTPMAVARNNEMPSIPIWSWSVDGFSSPDVHWNASSSNTFFQEGVAFPPGTLWVSPGHESSSNAFGVMRFTAPSNGLYRIETTARAYLDGASGDSDFHVLRNGAELFGQFLPAGAHTVGYSNVVELAAGNTVDFVVGRGMDGLLYASALKLEAVLTRISSTPGGTNPPPPTLPGQYDLSRDFALSNNPSGVWSYGWKSNFTAPLGLLADVRTFSADNGVPIRAWELTTMNLPVVAKVLGPDTAISDGDRFIAPAGTVYFAPGSDGTAQNYGVIRFRAPTGGVYRVETTVSQLFGSDRSRDSDFHVLRNGVEVFGAFLPPNSGTNFNGQFLLPSGGTIDFLVGRGADGLTADSGLKIAARIFRVTNAPPVTNPPPTVVVRDFDVSRDFAISNNPAGRWSYGWKSNFTGALSLLTDVRWFSADNGAAILVWERSTFNLPIVAKVFGPQTAESDNGNFIAPTGTVYFAPGADGTPHNYGIIRFTAPSNGQYHLETRVQQVFDNARSRDSDFHVLKSGVELFGAFLPPHGSTNYSTSLTLNAGEALEFAVGRGADGLTADSALKIAALITPGTNNTVPPNPPPPTNALVALWRANGDATDSVGTNHGTLVNAVGFAPGMDGQAFVLNGASYIRVPDASSLDFTQALSVALWFNRSTDLPFGTAVTLFDKRNLSSCNYGANMSENYGLTAFYDPTNGGFENLFAPLPTGGVWHHFVSTYSQTTGGVRVVTYVDGVIVASNRLSGSLASAVNDAPLAIGAARDGTGDHFIGLIDEVALYRRALSLAEVQAVYNSIPPTVNGEAAEISAEGFKFTLKGRPGATYLIEISEDLTTWNTLTNVVCASDKVLFCDPLVSQRARTFYRARVTNP